MSAPFAASVVVTTYRRVERLAACLEGVRSQTRPADDVVVVVHVSDDASAREVARFASAWPVLRCTRVDQHGSLAALNRGLGAARGEVVAFIDDDAVPSADWLERIVSKFERDERIVAVGGRDVIVVDGRVLDAPRRRFPGRHAGSLEVGRIQWFGRMIANHHLGAGEARDVDVLKGANMSFRRSAVVGHGFDERLRGPGAVVHSELSICLPLRRRGLRIVYDPGIVVQHYPAPRPLGDHRERDPAAVFSAAHNEALQILDYFGPLRRGVFLVWGLVVGTTEAPGLAVMARDLLTGRVAAWPRFRAGQRGRAAAWRTSRVPRPVPAPLRAGRSPTTTAVSVVVTTYRRVERLAACLEGLRLQTRPADEVLVAAHISDDASATEVARRANGWPGLRCVRVERHGLLAALNRGLGAAGGEIVAFVDDDAVPSVDWLERIVTAFERDERIAAVGGRDVIIEDGGPVVAARSRFFSRTGSGPEVGRIQWFGRVIANHHLGAGEARDVDVLKGANMSFWRAAVAAHGFDERLRGYGVEVHSELSICLPLRRRGLRVVYDPGIVVLHYPSPRSLGDQRDGLSRAGVFSAAHNEALQILDYFGPPRRAVFSVWGLVVGTTHAPGFAVLARELAAGRPGAWLRFRAGQRGRAAAWRTHRAPRQIPAPLSHRAAEAEPRRYRSVPTATLLRTGER